jgi:predicted TIM-barrel fold metal-dependent hydrolase
MSTEEQIIDIHCHLARINTYFKDMKDISFKNSKYLVFYKLWAKLIKMEWSNNVVELNGRFEKKLLELTNQSRINHFVILPLDGVYDKNGELINEDSVFYTSNDDIYEFCKKTEKLIPSASINPMRKDAFQELAKAVERGCALIKWLPGLQLFNPAGEQALAFARKCKEYNMPILVHLGQEFSFPGLKLEKKYHRLDTLTALLETGCKIIVAHAGGFSFLREKKTVSTLETLAKKFPNLYFDNSGMLVYQRRSRLLLLRKSPLLMSRLIFGTDYPCYAHTLPFVLNIKPQYTLEAMQTKNIFDRDAKIKKYLGFNHDIFARGYDVIYKK